MLTRRTLRRYYLLRPCQEVNQLYLYALAVFANKYGMLVHSAALMSTHPHEVVTDVLGNRPDFVRDFHRTVALGVKVVHKWEGSVWDSDETSVVELDTAEAIVDKLAYVITNPVAAGAVKQPEQWPGVLITVSDMGQTVLRIERPRFYFDPKNPDWPEVVELRIVTPQRLVDVYGSEAQARAVVQEAVDVKVAEAHQEAREKKWKFQGATRAKSISPYARGKSFEPLRATNPTFAVGKGQRSAFFECVAKLRDFRKAYKEALAAWRAGDRDVVFPYGTWAMAVIHGARVAAEPAG